MKSLTEQGRLATIVGQERAYGGAVCNSGVVLKTLDPSFEVRAFGKAGQDEHGTGFSPFSPRKGSPFPARRETWECGLRPPRSRF